MCSVDKSCLTLFDPLDYSPPGSSAHGIFKARILEWLPFPSPGDLPDPGIEPVYLVSPALGGFSTTEPPIVVQLLSCVWLFVTPWSHLASPKKIWRFSKSIDSRTVAGRTFSETLPIHEWGQGWLSHRLVCFVPSGTSVPVATPLVKNLLGSINLIKIVLATPMPSLRSLHQEE